MDSVSEDPGAITIAHHFLLTRVVRQASRDVADRLDVLDRADIELTSGLLVKCDQKLRRVKRVEAKLVYEISGFGNLGRIQMTTLANKTGHQVRRFLLSHGNSVICVRIG
jgi:hypothetical protein